MLGTHPLVCSIKVQYLGVNYQTFQKFLYSLGLREQPTPAPYKQSCQRESCQSQFNTCIDYIVKQNFILFYASCSKNQ